MLAFCCLITSLSCGGGGGSDPQPLPTTEAPTITSQPQCQTVNEGQPATFSASATGKPSPTYQWKIGGLAINGATSSSLTIPSTKTSDSGSTFTMTASNVAGSATSNPAMLTVNPIPTPPTITQQPQNQTVTAGQTATFTVTATGTPTLKYQWKRNGSTNVGSDSNIYTAPATTTSDNGSYFNVTVTNTYGSVYSNNAYLYVTAPPTITQQPQNQTVTAGQKATFTVTATGSPTLNYQWKRNGSTNVGSDSNAYTTPATTTSDNGEYFNVTVTNTYGSYTSNSAYLYVNLVPTSPTITQQPQNQTVTVGQMATFTVAATGQGPLDYQWYRNGSSLGPEAKQSSYTIIPTSTAANGSSFNAKVSNSFGLAMSNPAYLYVTDPAKPTINFFKVEPSTITAGNGAVLSWSVSNATSVSIDQGIGTVASSGTKNVNPTSTTTYTLTATNANGITTAPATLTVSPVITVSISPKTATLNTGETQTFSATVTGTSNMAVTWSKTGGEISGSGNTVTYTAPSTPGTYNVTARSVADTSKSDTATVTVKQVQAKIAKLKLKVTGSIAAGKKVGMWQVVMLAPSGTVTTWQNPTRLGIKTESSASNKIDASAFYSSPTSYSVMGTFNPPDASYTQPYLKLGSDLSGANANPGEIATLIFQLAPGATAPTLNEFSLSGTTIYEAGSFSKLAGAQMEFDLTIENASVATPEGLPQIEMQDFSRLGGHLQATAAGCTLGDVDANGSITLDDAVMALQASLNIPITGSKTNADVYPVDSNGYSTPDGQITLDDAVLILQASLNIVKIQCANPTSVTLKLRLTGSLSGGDTAGSWNADVLTPSGTVTSLDDPTCLSIKTLSDKKQLDASAFFASGLTPTSAMLMGSFNTPDTTWNQPYLKLASMNLGSGTAIGEIASVVFSLVPGSPLPTKNDFQLRNVSVKKAGSTTVLNGIGMDFDLIAGYDPAGINVSLSPSSATMNTGASQPFTATVTGTSNTAVTWSATCGNVVGSGSTVTYTAPGVMGTCSLKATSVADPSKFAQAVITVVQVPIVPVILTQPTSVTVQEGQTANFYVVASGNPSPEYQWKKNGTSLNPNGQQSSYTTPPTSMSDNGALFTVAVFNVAGSVESSPATLTVSPIPVVQVSISPQSVTLAPNGTQQFTATVTGTSITAVTWSCTGGSVSNSGSYTAPATAGTYTVTATSQADNTKSATATVTVNQVSVSISPQTVTLAPNGTQQFTATVTGSTNTAVTWTCSGGSVNNSGFYTAPGTAGTYTVTATSQADTTKSATASVTVQAQADFSLSVTTPSAIQPGSSGTTTVTATRINGHTAAISLSIASNSQNITGSGSIASGSNTGTLTIQVPSGATPGDYSLTINGTAGSLVRSANTTLKINSNITVTVSPSTATILTGATQQFAATVTGTSNTTVTWSATGGSISTSGVYTAPQTAGTYTVWATSNAYPNAKGSAYVTVNAVQVIITPSTAVFSSASATSLQFVASVTGSNNTAVTWSVVEPNGGTVSSTGLYSIGPKNGTYNLRATSVADSSKKADATITINGCIDFRIHTIYLIQTTQRIDGSIPIMRGRDAYLRAWVLTNKASFLQPKVRVRMYDSSGQLTLNEKRVYTPQSIFIENDETYSFNMLIPGNQINPGC